MIQKYERFRNQKGNVKDQKNRNKKNYQKTEKLIVLSTENQNIVLQYSDTRARASYGLLYN